jgi:hypothetical protein
MAYAELREINTSEPSAAANIFELPVYVPGYSLYGAENTPTLVRTLPEFKRLFGSTPYEFKTAQFGKFGGITVPFQSKQTLERGYIMAYEYLSLGHPVVFERIINPNQTGLTKAAYTVPLVSKTYKAEVPVTQTNSETIMFDMTDDGEGTYTYTYNGDLKRIIDDMYGIKDGTATIEVNGYAFTVDATGAIAAVTGQADPGFTADANSGAPLPRNAPNKPTFVITSTTLYTSTTALIAWTINADMVDYLMASDINGTTFSYYNSSDELVTMPSQYTLEFTGDGFRAILPNQTIAISGIIPEIAEDTNGFIVKAKYHGAYGAGVTISIDSPAETYVQVLHATFDNTTEDHYFTLDRDDPMFIENIVSDIIEVDASNIGTNAQTNDHWFISAKTIMSPVPLVYDGDANADEFLTQYLYEQMSTDAWWSRQDIKDKCIAEYRIFTTGPYALYNISDIATAQRQLQAVSEMGLAHTLVDYYGDLNYNQVKSKLAALVNGTNSRGEPYGAYGAMFYKTHMYNTAFGRQMLPGSFAYVMDFIKSIRANKPWEAVAGTGINGNGRGIVSNIVDSDKLGSEIANVLQSKFGVRVNPIQYFRDMGGSVIMGNATLYNNVSGALTNYSFWNIRILTTIIKSGWFDILTGVLFEQNDTASWLKVKDRGTRFMSLLVNRGLRTEHPITGKPMKPFEITKVPTTEMGKFKVHIKFFPIEAIEEAEATAELADGYVIVE